LLGLDSLLAGALGVELEAKVIDCLVHLVTEVGRLFFNSVLHMLPGVGTQWLWWGSGSWGRECGFSLHLVDAREPIE
jgi:hypothetical protein